MLFVEFSDVELFTIFNIDCGAAIEGAIRSESREPTPSEAKSIRKLSGVNAWQLRPRQRTGKVVDFDTESRKDLEDKRDKERRARVEQLCGIIKSNEYLDELEENNTPICSLLPPPQWI